MSRGLSEHQEKIIILALKNRETRLSDHATDGGADLYLHEAIHEVFGVPYGVMWSGTDQEYTEADARHPGRQFFREVDARRVNAARASTSRAFLRLHDRGLCELYSGAATQWAGIRLTEEGVKVAESLSVKGPQNSDNT